MSRFSRAPRRLLGAEAHGLLNTSATLTREQAQELVEKIVGMSKADAVSVSVQSGRDTNLRFADNQMSTSGATTNTTVRIQSVFGKRRASVVTNDRSDESLRRAVEQSEAIARIAPEDPEYMGELGPQTYQPISSWFDSTAEMSAEDRARAALTALAPARASKDITVAGFIICDARASAMGNSAGLFAYHRSTGVNYTLTARTNDGTGSGWAGADGNDWTQLDFEAVARHAIDKARRSQNPVALEPGRYTVIMEPEATGNLVSTIRGAFQARSAEEGRSTFSKQGGGTKVGEQILDSRVTLSSDPADPLTLGSPFDGDGMPASRQVWVENGVLKQLSYSRYWAQRQGRQANPGGNSLRLEGGNESTESLIASTERGILVTRLWYLRAVNPRNLIYTGLTRDGTFLIEGGKITRSVKNFRFNDSPLFILNNIEGIGAAERVAGGGSLIMPTIKVRDFNFTSLSDAV